jgi:hypothetical protein
VFERKAPICGVVEKFAILTTFRVALVANFSTPCIWTTFFCSALSKKSRFSSISPCLFPGSKILSINSGTRKHTGILLFQERNQEGILASEQNTA